MTEELKLSIPFIGFVELEKLRSIKKGLEKLSIPFIGFQYVGRVPPNELENLSFQFHLLDSGVENVVFIDGSEIDKLSIPFIGFSTRSREEPSACCLNGWLSIPFIGF